MKKTVKKGFTLVELLVVIAILAILATVSVVGYTAFIERANLAVDQDTADQVTHFLTAMRADSTGKYYNEPITPQNVWEVIDAALEENGTLTDLVPKTEGYHYFFKFDKNEAGEYEDGEIVVAKKADIITKTAKGFFLAHAIDPATDEYGVGFFTAPDSEGNEILYFFLDTKGSSLATAINALQNIPIKGWERIEGSTTDEKIKNAIQAVADAKTETNEKADYTDLLNNTRFVNKEGQIATNEIANGNIIFIEENASAGDTVTVVTITNESGTPAIRKSEPVSAQPLNPDDKTTITVPAGAQISAGALNVAESNTNVTIVIETGSLSDIATSEGNPGTIEAGFTNTNTNVTIKVDNDNGTYTVDANITIIVKVDGETTTNTEHSLGTGLFPMRSFKITANNVDKKTDLRSNDSVYVAVDINGGISFDIKNIEGVSGKPVSKGNVEYEITGMTVEGVDTVTNWDTYATLTGNKIEFKMDTNDYYHKINTITIKATAEKPYEGDTKATAEYTIYVVRPTGISSTLGGEKPNTDGVFTLGNAQVTYDESGNASKVNSTFTFSSQINTYNREYDESKLTFDNTTTLLSDTNLTCGTDSNGNSTITLIKDVQTTDESGNITTTERFAITDAEITVKVGSFFQKTYKVTLYDQCQLAWNKTNSNIRYLGNEGAKLNSSVILARNDSVEKPEGALLYVFSGTGDAPKYPCKSSAFTVVSSKTPDGTQTVYTVDYTTDDKGNITGASIIFGESITAETRWKIAWAVRTTNAKGESEYEIVSDMYDIRAVPAWNINGTNPQINGEYVFKTDSFTGNNWIHVHKEEKCKDNTKGAHETIKHNLVLLSDYVFTDRQYLGLSESTLYGNLFTLDVTNGRNNSTGIVELVKSTLMDTKVIAAEYTETNDAWLTDYGLVGGYHVYDNEYSAAAVRVYGESSTISNCYIFGARSALRVESSGTYLKNVVLVGGAYANLNIENAITVNLENVVTVNQYTYYSDEGVEKTINGMFGCGIIVANSTSTAQLKIVGDQSLKQFNFIGCSDVEISHVYDEIGFSATVKDIVNGRNDDYSDFLQFFKYSYSNTDYFAINILESKATAADSGGNNVNITINGTPELPAYQSKNAYDTRINGYIIGISFNNGEHDNYRDYGTKDKEDDFENTSYGFAFSVENFLKEGSKYYPENIGKTSSVWTGSYDWKYRD